MDRRTTVIARLKNPAIPDRPTTQKALVAHLKTMLGKEYSEAVAEDILRELREESGLTIDPKGRVAYG